MIQRLAAAANARRPRHEHALLLSAGVARQRKWLPPSDLVAKDRDRSGVALAHCGARPASKVPCLSRCLCGPGNRHWHLATDRHLPADFDGDPMRRHAISTNGKIPAPCLLDFLQIALCRRPILSQPVPLILEQNQTISPNKSDVHNHPTHSRRMRMRSDSL